MRVRSDSFTVARGSGLGKGVHRGKRMGVTVRGTRKFFSVSFLVSFASAGISSFCSLHGHCVLLSGVFTLSLLLLRNQPRLRPDILGTWATEYKHVWDA